MKRKFISIGGLIFLSIILFGGGFWVGQAQAFKSNWQSNWMMGNANNMAQSGYGMMGNSSGQIMSGMMNGQFGSSMMGGSMMGNFGVGLAEVEPLSLEAAETAVSNYLTTLDNNNLALGEIMIFDNHAYAQIIDEASQIGAFEVLVDPVSGDVFPEPGPNMMWNTKYGMMSGAQTSSYMMGGDHFGNMMGSFGYAPDAEINISAGEAITVAQDYLDAYLAGKTADETADEFPGYYTLHVLEDGQPVSMLSVNTNTGQVFLHHWHGEFVEMAGENHS